MQNYLIKICGVTNLADARMIDALGVDFLGMVLHPESKRRIREDSLKTILASEIPTQKVLVFGYDPVEYIQNAWQRFGDDKILLQLPAKHTAFDEIISGIPKKQILPSYAVEEKINATDLVKWQDFSLLLLDSGSAKIAGGTGKVFDWSRIHEIKRPYLLAGGLNPENISQAMAETLAIGFDTAGGTEATAGIKDPVKTRDFISQIRQAAQK